MLRNLGYARQLNLFVTLGAMGITKEVLGYEVL